MKAQREMNDYPEYTLAPRQPTSYKKGDDVPSWIMTTHNGPSVKFGCDVKVEPRSAFTSTVTAVPRTGDTVFQVFGGEHHIVPFTSINISPGMTCMCIRGGEKKQLRKEVH